MAVQRIGYFDDGELRAGTGRYLAEIIGALDRARFKPVFFAPSPRPWHEDLARLDVEMVYGLPNRTRTSDAFVSEGHGAVGRTAKEFIPSHGSSNTSSHGSSNAPSREMSADSGRWPVRLSKPVSWTLGLLRDTVRLARLFRSSRVDLLHSNNTGAEPAPIAARLARVPRVIGTLHVLPSYDLDGERGGMRYRLLEKASMRALDHVIACCDAARKDWSARCGLPAGKVTVIHNGIQVDRVTRRHSVAQARNLLNLPLSAFITVTIGNLHRYKGQEFLLRAMPALVARHPEVLAVIAGSGPAEDDLRRLVAELKLERNVRLLGFCSEIGTLLDAADLYVQSSLVEAFPIAILEAAASGLPIVSTAVGGVPEAIDDGVTGLLVPPADPPALARAIGSLVDCPERCDLLGQAGRARVISSFTTAQMLDKTTRLYERILAQV